MTTYKPTAQARNWAKEHAAAIVAIHPKLFLDMTTSSDEHAASIRSAAKPLAFYQQRTDLEHPFLHVDYATGIIGGHEGRHRAAAVEAAGGTQYPLAILIDNLPKRFVPKPFERFSQDRFAEVNMPRTPSWSDVPKTWSSPYRASFYDISSLVSEDSIFVIEPSPQRSYYYSNSRAGMPDQPSERPAWWCVVCGSPQASIAQHHDHNVDLACGHTAKLWQLRWAMQHHNQDHVQDDQFFYDPSCGYTRKRVDDRIESGHLNLPDFSPVDPR